MPTTCTLVSRLADAAKKVADPPMTFSAFPNGVSTESRATEPTTSTVMLRWVRVEKRCARAVRRSHPVRRGDAEHGESVAQHDAARLREEEPRVHNLRRLAEHMMLVIPGVHQLRGLEEIASHTVRLERLGRAREQRRKVEQRLDELALLGLHEHIEVDRRG